MSTALTQQRAVEIIEQRIGYPSLGVFNYVHEKDLIAAMEQYHREASAARCPDCGERNPASIHTCSPQKPDSDEGLRRMLDLVNETDSARWEIGFRNIVSVLYGPRHRFEIADVVERVRDLAQSAPQPDSVAELEAEVEKYRKAAECGQHYGKLMDAAARSLVEDCNELERQRDEARAEVERLRKDAERLEWVFEHPQHFEDICEEIWAESNPTRNWGDGVEARSRIDAAIDGIGNTLRADDLDKAIDVVLAAKGKKKHDGPCWRQGSADCGC